MNADSILTLLDLGYAGHRTLYYKGHELDSTIHEPEAIDASVTVSDFFTSCYALEPH